MRKALLAIVVSLVFALVMPVTSAWAATDLDEILNYTIKVDVNDDATLDMNYHVEWKVLDSTKEGPLTWVLIGIPNKHYLKLESSSPTVKSIRFDTTNGTCARIDLDRAYKAGEVVTFDFHLVQDYMYQMDRDTEGETVYEFTPGWFNDIKVDNLVVKWRADKIEQHMPAAELTEDGYLTWSTQLEKGKRFKVAITYKNDAFAFNATKKIENGQNKGSSSTPSSTNTYPPSSTGLSLDNVPGLIMVFMIFFICFARFLVGLFGTASFVSNSGFTGGKKITRTKVVYYPECQGCGGPREEGKDNCPYCGRSFVKSEEIVTEEELPPEESTIKNKEENGLYPFASQPNTYLRVHVVPIATSHSRSSSRSSSCACACACGCACACACAGGGRAGCSTKDFYNTGLRLKQLEVKKKA